MLRRLGMLAVAGLGFASFVDSDEPQSKIEVVTPKDDGIIATGINARGEVVGFEWVDDKAHPGVLEQAPFYARGKEVTYIPMLEGYTATFPAGVSDEGLVVGRVSKPQPRGRNVKVHLRNQAFIWDAQNGIRGLGALEGDSASLGCGVSRDGRRISGYSIGDNRVRACVWDRAGETWKGLALPQEGILGSTVVAISDDGRCVTAIDGGVPCLWTRETDGRWTRKVIAEAGMLVPRAVNNAATVVGVRFTRDGGTHAVLWARDGGYKAIEEPAGYVKSEASAINNRGVVVGMIDGGAGSKFGPRGFAYENGRVRILDEGGPNFVAATAINDQGQVAGVLEKDADEPPPADEPARKPKANDRLGYSSGK
jgi:uncharacterized membrane protein